MSTRSVAAAVAGLLAAGAVAALAGGPIAQAAAPQDTDARVVLPTMSWITTGVRLGTDPDKAAVLGRYRCTKDGADTSMRVSARQAPGVGSSDLAPGSVAWYAAELRSFAEDAGFAAVCDRRWHAGRVIVEKEIGTLRKGPALVGYCLHDDDEKPVNSPGYTASCTLESVPVR